MYLVIGRAISLALLLAMGTGKARAQNLTLAPHEIPEGAKSVRLKVQRVDGQPFTEQSDGVLSVGIAYGTKLFMFEAKPDRPESPRVLIVIIKDLALAWSPAPRAGDELLVAVYLNKRPITAAASLSVVGPAQPSSSRETISFVKAASLVLLCTNILRFDLAHPQLRLISMSYRKS
ncbi:MAG: hypothetical protein L0229_01125 [Blastocatellia bacterium]|nr:hypothetical protein [Blastocatellia bacterium]